VAGGKRTAADLGAWLISEDESGQGLRPPKGRTWGRRGCTPVVKVTGGSNRRVSLAALIAIKPGHRARLIYRVHQGRRRGKDQRKGFTETDYARLFAVNHAQGPAQGVSHQVDRVLHPPRAPQGAGVQRRPQRPRAEPFVAVASPTVRSARARSRLWLISRLRNPTRVPLENGG